MTPYLSTEDILGSTLSVIMSNMLKLLSTIPRISIPSRGGSLAIDTRCPPIVPIMNMTMRENKPPPGNPWGPVTDIIHNHTKEKINKNVRIWASCWG